MKSEYVAESCDGVVVVVVDDDFNSFDSWEQHSPYIQIVFRMIPQTYMVYSIVSPLTWLHSMEIVPIPAQPQQLFPCPSTIYHNAKPHSQEQHLSPVKHRCSSHWTDLFISRGGLLMVGAQSHASKIGHGWGWAREE